MTGDRRSPNQFEVLGSEMAYSGWRNILKKTVRIDSERNYVFDVVHQVKLLLYNFSLWQNPPRKRIISVACSHQLGNVSMARWLQYGNLCFPLEFEPKIELYG